MCYRSVPLLRFNSLEFMMLATSPRQFGLLAPALMALVLGAPRAFALDIELVPTANLSANSAALAAFSRAAARWSEHLLDPITVRITADFSALGSASTIGQASSVLIYSDSYAEIRDAMVADAALEADDGIVANLPSFNELGVLMPRRNSVLANSLYATKANLKALSFTGLDAEFGASDGAISFNSGFAFDFNSADGVAPGTMDFETVAVHEIGHVLGFTSVVDLLDAGYRGPIALSTLDLFRFAPADTPADASEFRIAIRNVVPGGVMLFSDTSTVAQFATGAARGDGRQASHWKDGSPAVGVMDPTLAFGELSPISALDLRALDLIGWNVAPTPVPWPASGALLAAGCWLLRRGRRQR
jgi:hypothetical protein